ncbi:MAG: hypothetical protein WAL56_05910 [Candidatus Sulfotelmatobacter sp.]
MNQNIDKLRILQASYRRDFLPLIPSTTISFMERKIFWTVFTVLGLLADFLLPIWWGLAATIPCLFIAWWVAYRSDWF